MGSEETATATTGGPRVIDVFYGDGAPSGPNYLLFSDADRPSDSLRDGLVVGKRLHRMRRRCGSLGLSESPGSNKGIKVAIPLWPAERNRPKMIEAAAHAV